MRIADLNSLDRDAFVELLGGVFEHSPWVAECAWAKRPFPARGALSEAMRRCAEQAPREQQLALIRAHPDLGTRARVGPASQREQSAAGLDQLTATEYEELTRLNSAYRSRFGFPFLYAVQGSTKAMILQALRKRLASSPEEEFEEALRQIYRIAGFRLETIFPDDSL